MELVLVPCCETIRGKEIKDDKLISYVKLYAEAESGERFRLSVHKDYKKAFNDILRNGGYVIGEIKQTDRKE